MKNTFYKYSCSQLLRVVLIFSIGLSACGVFRQLSDANLPAQYVVASIDGNFRQDAFVSIHRSASGNLKTWSSSVLFTNGNGPNVDVIHGGPPFTTTILGRGGSSPGIGSNGKFYVLAFWGRPTTTPVDNPNINMFVSLSHDGVAWTVPTPFHVSSNVHSNFSGVVGRSGISVAPTGENGNWFASYADATDSITIVPIPVNAQGEIDLAINTDAVTIQSATTHRSPALSYLNGNLVLAWRIPGPSGSVRILMTQDGRAWPPATNAILPTIADGTASPQPLTIEDSAPFLHSSGHALFLTSTAFLPGTTGTGNAGRINLYSSTDGNSFTLVKAIPITDPLYEGASAAGPVPTEFVVVYPTLLRSSTTVFTSALEERTIATRTNHRVTVAGGP